MSIYGFQIKHEPMDPQIPGMDMEVGDRPPKRKRLTMIEVLVPTLKEVNEARKRGKYELEKV